MHPSTEAGPSRPGRSRSKTLPKKAEDPAPSAMLVHHSNMDDMPVFSPVLRKIPRPPNAFILYRSAKMREISNSDKDRNTGTGLGKLDYQRQLSKQIGQLWRNETPEVKAAFYDKSKQAAREHAQRYPEYRFKPGKKGAATADDPSTSSTAAKSVADTTSHSRTVSNDFSPVTGPVSGSGSGSGRKRASLESARSKASPYSASHHRRSSSANSTSPSRRRSSDPIKQSPIHHVDPIALHQPTPSLVIAPQQQQRHHTSHRTSAEHAPTIHRRKPPSTRFFHRTSESGPASSWLRSTTLTPRRFLSVRLSPPLRRSQSSIPNAKPRPHQTDQRSVSPRLSSAPYHPSDALFCTLP